MFRLQESTTQPARCPHRQETGLRTLQAMKKTTVKITVMLDVHHNEDVEVQDALSEMDYVFTADPDSGADIQDSQITDWEVVDSR